MSTASASPKYKDVFDAPEGTSQPLGSGIASASSWSEQPRQTAHLSALFSDLLLVLLNAYIVYVFRSGVLGLPWASAHPQFPAVRGKEDLALGVLYGTLTLLIGRSLETPPARAGCVITQAIWQRGKAVAGATLLLGIFLFAYGFQVDVLSIAALGLLNVVALSGWSLWWTDGGVRQRFQPRDRRHNLLIVGAGPVARSLSGFLESNPRLGYTVRGFLDSKLDGDARVLGTVEDFSRVVHTEFIDEVVVTLPADREVLETITSEARRHHVSLKVVPDFYGSIGSPAQVQTLGRYPLISLHREPIPQFSLGLKRLMDILLASLALAALSPLLLVIAIAIKLDSEGPVIYGAMRAGKKGKRFTCYKFRTMVTGADDLKGKLRQINERSGPFFKLANDPRITRMGKWLRKYSLDEIPQFVNVLKGDMSIVGPRPHPLDDFERYAWAHLRRLTVLPGITGLWQVRARRDPSFDKTMELDLQYIESWSLWLDLKILWRTVFAVLEGGGQ